MNETILLSVPLERFVINLPESVEQGFVQAVRVRRCLAENQTCAYPACEAKKTVCRSE